MSAPVDVRQNPDGSWTAKGGTSLTVVSVTALTEHKAVAGHAVALCAIQSQGKGWIKCSDRLPADIDPVLAFGQSDSNDTEHVFIGWTDGDNWFEVNNGDYIDGGYGQDYDAVATHWQPLPADPTE